MTLIGRLRAACSIAAILCGSYTYCTKADEITEAWRSLHELREPIMDLSDPDEHMVDTGAFSDTSGSAYNRRFNADTNSVNKLSAIKNSNSEVGETPQLPELPDIPELPISVPPSAKSSSNPAEQLLDDRLMDNITDDVILSDPDLFSNDKHGSDVDNTNSGLSIIESPSETKQENVPEKSIGGVPSGGHTTLSTDDLVKELSEPVIMDAGNKTADNMTPKESNVPTVTLQADERGEGVPAQLHGYDLPANDEPISQSEIKSPQKGEVLDLDIQKPKSKPQLEIKPEARPELEPKNRPGLESEPKSRLSAKTKINEPANNDSLDVPSKPKDIAQSEISVHEGSQGNYIISADEFKKMEDVLSKRGELERARKLQIDKMEKRSDVDKANSASQIWGNRARVQKKIQSKAYVLYDADTFLQSERNFVYSADYKRYIFFAIAKGDTGTVDALLNVVRDTEIRNQYGETPLLFAVRIGNVSMVRYMIVRGADVDAKNSSDIGAIQLAQDMKRPDIIEALNEAKG